MHYHSEELVNTLSKKAQAFRMQVLEMVYQAQTGHIGGAFSIAEILTALYFHHLRIDGSPPDLKSNDKVLLSKGHACAMLYTVLAHRGYFPVEELKTFRKLNSRLQGHPECSKLPGIEICAGPLGHGIAIGTGMALAKRMDIEKPSAFTAPSAKASHGNVYVIVGDGEINAGVIWEGAMTAAKYRLGNLTVILDYNGIQQTGATADVMPTEPIAEKWRSFGWWTTEIHGHSVKQVLDALDCADEVHAQPSIIIARTTKGKGVGLFEYDNRWHGQAPNKQQYEEAKKELKNKG
ncbi:MAG: transketolase [Spirochaetota bacterium]|nr:MAG: transketolase [Spirochaetota bacterium]